MKPMTPVKEMMLAVANVPNAIHTMSTRLELTPKLVAVSSPRLMTFISQECLIIRISATKTRGTMINMISHIALVRLPRSQKTIPLAAYRGAIYWISASMAEKR